MKTITTSFLLLGILCATMPSASSASAMPMKSFCSLPNKTLRRGASEKNSESLRSILQFYKTYRYNNFGDVYQDSDDYEVGFGKKMKNDVKFFQKYNNLQQDGVVGPKTRKMILAFCNAQYTKGAGKEESLGKEITAMVGQRIKVDETMTEFVVTQIYGNSCEAGMKTNPNTNCIALYDPVVGVNAILGGDASVGEKIVRPGNSEQFGAYKITVVSIYSPEIPQSVVLKIERTEQ